jgi:hypothetical protein
VLPITKEEKITSVNFFLFQTFIFLLRKAIIFFSLIFLGNSVIIQTIMIQIDKKKIEDNFDNLVYDG